jgi:hypothetical protein
MRDRNSSPAIESPPTCEIGPGIRLLGETNGVNNSKNRSAEHDHHMPRMNESM